ncbi:MAG: hypothetical protein FJZ09_04540 [Candidatus Omnitrophica bacterium]|nr:hypothetical protein [Candidatus Omnitrophota bacterium]
MTDNFGRKKIKDLVIGALKDNLRNKKPDIRIDDLTPLFGAKSYLDSMGIMGLIVDIETRLNDEGIDITLISEKSLSDAKSPFKNVSTLVDFIAGSLEKKKASGS